MEADFKANLSQPLIAQSFGTGSTVASGFPIHYQGKDPTLLHFRLHHQGEGRQKACHKTNSIP